MPSQDPSKLTALPRSVYRLRLGLVSFGLLALAFSQSPGEVAADTKLDLVVSPGRFLRNALSMWDPYASAGQLQDQAYGYLFPMGPFFLIGRAVGLSPWVVQRGWESAVLIAAFLGVVRLSRLLGVPGALPRVAAGLSYALAPRMISELGSISSELLPMALLPWMLIPLVGASQRSTARRSAARSALAVLATGGINASASLAVLPVVALWLLICERGPYRRALIGWWLAAVALVSAWWAVPLAMLGRYSQPFLNWIESSATTTSVTTLLDVLRGNDHWLAFLGPSFWPAGWMFVAAPAAVLGSTAVAAVGIAGLAQPRTPFRVFLITSLLLGLALTTIGHPASVGPIFQRELRTLLDGPLSAFRNVHKFDPVLRLPLAIGVGHCGARLLGWRQRHSGPRGVMLYPRFTAVATAVALACCAWAPALSGRIVSAPRPVAVPGWWQQTGRWLGQHQDGGRALVVPGAATPDYLWGDPTDDALQPVAGGPWAVRNNLPLSQPGFVRLLDDVDQRLSNGVADPLLGPLLDRAGIQYLVVRNDLDSRASESTPLVFVHATLAATAGWKQVAQFGPNVTEADDFRLTEYGILQPRGSVDVYENPDWSGAQADLAPASDLVQANGSTDDLPQLLQANLNPSAPAVFGGSDQRSAATLLTDGISRREFQLGRVGAYSGLMTADQAFVQPRVAHDFLPQQDAVTTPVTYHGISAITASSSGSAPGLFYTSATDAPWSAVDGNPATAWRSTPNSGTVGQWLQLNFPRPTALGAITIAFDSLLGSFPTRLRLSTETASQEISVQPKASAQTLRTRLPAGTGLRLTVLGTSAPADRVGIADLAVAGVRISRTLAVPGRSDPDVISFATSMGARPACLPTGHGVACDSSWAEAGEDDLALDRSFSTSSASAYRATARLRAQPGATLDALLDQGNPVQATASSVDTADPRQRPGAAVDGVLDTGWVAAPGDRTATLHLKLASPVSVRAIQLTPFAQAPVASPTEVEITAGAQHFAAAVDGTGLIQLPSPVQAAQVDIEVLTSTLRSSTNSLTGQAQLLPVGIAEVRLVGTDLPSRAPTAAVPIGPDLAPALVFDGQSVPLHGVASRADLLAGNPIDFTPATSGELQSAAGGHRLRLAANALLRPAGVVLSRIDLAAATAKPVAGQLKLRQWDSGVRRLDVSTETGALLVVHENANPGWTATIGGHSLKALTVDGWQQGYLLPAGTAGTVTLRFRPQRIVDAAFLAGGAGVLIVLVLALVPFRRRRTEPCRPERSHRADPPGRSKLWPLVSLLLCVVIGSWPGALCFLLAWLGRRWLPAGLRLRMLAPTLLLLAGLVAALGAHAHDFGFSNSLAAQLSCLIALAWLSTDPGWSSPAGAEAAEQGAL